MLVLGQTKCVLMGKGKKKKKKRGKRAGFAPSAHTSGSWQPSAGSETCQAHGPERGWGQGHSGCLGTSGLLLTLWLPKYSSWSTSCPRELLQKDASIPTLCTRTRQPGLFSLLAVSRKEKKPHTTPRHPTVALCAPPAHAPHVLLLARDPHPPCGHLQKAPAGQSSPQGSASHPLFVGLLSTPC